MDGETIAAMRKSLGLTQQQLAELLGVALATVARWEIGAHAPRGRSLKMLHAFESLCAARDTGDAESKAILDAISRHIRTGMLPGPGAASLLGAAIGGPLGALTAAMALGQVRLEPPPAPILAPRKAAPKTRKAAIPAKKKRAAKR